ncbi:MAG: GNAT family N-acetyltransferase [Gammaproteobacteria bacterium]|nr:GNAT family N-acetyltransferase [Gammaproteobacteria bacterium]MDE2261048.1 GNAT family N-acetyltransferase [Gammaproteobacteria bacterium]
MAEAINEERLVARIWSEDDFRCARGVWNRLLESSAADPLFLSWEWQWQWWVHHRDFLQADLRVVAVYTRGDILVGIAPFYSRAAAGRGIRPTSRLELIGTAWRLGAAAFSDYLDMIVTRGSSSAVARCVAEWLLGQAFWRETALCCVRRDGPAAGLARELARNGLFVREVDPLSAWCVRLPAAFDEYVGSLDSHTRRRLWRHRRRLSAPLLEYADGSQVEEYLGLLWRMMAQRWGEAKEAPAARRFQVDAAISLAKGGRLRLSRLSTSAGPLSIMYGARIGRTVYYLQSAFDGGSRGISPGILHLGYAMEDACREGVEYFDLLAGKGRKRDYKRELGASLVPVVNFHVVRGAFAAALYGTYEAVKARLMPGRPVQRDSFAAR